MDERVWELLEQADALPAGAERQSLLLRALDGLDVLDPRALEGRAVVLAMIALDDERFLPQAVAACEAARESRADTAFPLAHLAEAMLKHGRFEDALNACADAPFEYFEERDLHWRNVRLDQIRAASLIRLGRIREAELVVQRMLRELGREGDDDFYPAPIELVAALIEHAQETGSERGVQAIAQRILASPIADTWFAPEMTAKLKQIG